MTYFYLIENCYEDHNKVYIGKTKIEGSRKNKHKSSFGKNIYCTTIDYISSEDKKIWKPIETFWINYFRFLGFDVQNKNEGGGGCIEASIEMREKISKANKGKIRTEEHKQNYKGSKSEEHKQNISKSRLGIPSPKKGKKTGPNHKLKGRPSPMKGKSNLGIKGKLGHRTGKGTNKILDVKNNIIFNTQVECAKYNGLNINKMYKLLNLNIDYKKI